MPLLIAAERTILQTERLGAWCGLVVFGAPGNAQSAELRCILALGTVLFMMLADSKAGPKLALMADASLLIAVLLP
jgi:hypothetical protein